MRSCCLLVLVSVLLGQEWSGRFDYIVREGRPAPAADERDELMAMDAGLRAQLARIEAQLEETPVDRLQTRRRLRADRAVLSDERRQVALALGGSRVLERLTIRLERVRAAPEPVGPDSLARLETSFRHRIIDHAAATVIDDADGLVLEDRIVRPPLRGMLGGQGGEYRGRPTQLVQEDGYQARLVSGLPNPFRCVATRELLALDDIAFLASLPGMPLSVRIDLDDGRWREWRLVDCQEGDPSP